MTKPNETQPKQPFIDARYLSQEIIQHTQQQNSRNVTQSAAQSTSMLPLSGAFFQQQAAQQTLLNMIQKTRGTVMQEAVARASEAAVNLLQSNLAIGPTLSIPSVARPVESMNSGAPAPSSQLLNPDTNLGFQDECARIPCRARGMPKEHNYEVAYFNISKDTKHGQGLLCSFPACRKAGIRFRYCAYCKNAIAKRGFGGHKHPDLKPPPTSENRTTKAYPGKKTARVGDRYRTASLREPNGSEEYSTIPCRARGMPMEHNYEVAYFKISKETKHGDPLVCSFTACRDTGIKFRYCAYCKNAITKRQFDSQHQHQEKKRKAPPTEEDPNTHPKQRPRFAALPKEKARENPSEVSPPILSATDSSFGHHANPSETATSSSIYETSSSASKEMSDGSHENGDTKELGKREESSGDGDNQSDSENSIDEQQRNHAWTILLDNRPGNDDPERLDWWLSMVRLCSDTTILLDEVLEKIRRECTISTSSSSASSTSTSYSSDTNSDTSSSDDSGCSSSSS